MVPLNHKQGSGHGYMGTITSGVDEQPLRRLGCVSVRGRCFKFRFHLFKIWIALIYHYSKVSNKFINQPIIKWRFYFHLVSSHVCDGSVMVGNLANITWG